MILHPRGVFHDLLTHDPIVSKEHQKPRLAALTRDPPQLQLVLGHV